MKTIPLTQGKEALVDDDDFERLKHFKWYFTGKNGYAGRMVRRNGKRLLTHMHWYILRLPPGLVIDHINGNRLDNRKENLRVCTKADNNKNRRLVKVNASSQFKGVTWRAHARAWKAYIKINRKQIHLGYFKDEQEAARAYNRAAVEIFGEYAQLNEVPT